MSKEPFREAAPPRIKWIDHTHYIKLIPPKEFSFAANLGYLSRSANECMYQIEGAVIVKLIPAENNFVLAAISGAADGSIRVEWMGTVEPPKPSVREWAAKYFWDWFDLDTDLTAFYEMAGGDPLLSKVASEFYGLRIIGITDLFEALCWGIMGQQINLTFAYTLKKRFVETFGRHVEWNNRSYWMFPTPEAVAELSVSDLKPLQLTEKKSEYLIGVAKLISEGLLSKLKLQELGDCNAAERELVKIRGIGPWTANYVLMRCLRYPSAFPIDDVGLHNAIKYVLKRAAKPTVEEIRGLSSGWGDWKSYATYYLWRTVY